MVPLGRVTMHVCRRRPSDERSANMRASSGGGRKARSEAFSRKVRANQRSHFSNGRSARMCQKAVTTVAWALLLTWPQSTLSTCEQFPLSVIWLAPHGCTSGVCGLPLHTASGGMLRSRAQSCSNTAMAGIERGRRGGPRGAWPRQTEQNTLARPTARMGGKGSRQSRKRGRGLDGTAGGGRDGEQATAVGRGWRA